jgi:hypothetical protein
MNPQTPFKRLVLRAVLRNVSPMVIRVLAVPDSLDLPSFDEVFRSMLRWEGLGYIFRVHGQEFNSFHRRTKSKQLREFHLRPQEKFLYTCGAIDLWEWEFRLLDQGEGADGDKIPICLAGRGAAPPDYCGAPTGYRLMLKRQAYPAYTSASGTNLSTPVVHTNGTIFTVDGSSVVGINPTTGLPNFSVAMQNSTNNGVSLGSPLSCFLNKCTDGISQGDLSLMGAQSFPPSSQAPLGVPAASVQKFTLRTPFSAFQ